MAAEQLDNGADIADAAAPDRDTTASFRLPTLVPVNQEATRQPTRSRLADAVFLAHMIATKVRAPQTCAKRRVDPDEASASYNQTTQPAVRTGRIVSRKI